MKKKILIGVSWPYSNGPMHIGHLAGQNIVCDVFARFHRMKGNDVLMVSGSDTHGTPITVKAEEKGIPIEEFWRENHKNFLEIFKTLQVSFDLFTDTHTENHKEVTQNFIRILDEKGYLLRKETEQFYDEKAQRFLVDRYIEGKCPYCGYIPARGDQCDSCGHVLTPEELIDPVSKLTGTTPVMRKSEHLFFDLSKLQKPLESYIKDKTYWRKNTLEFSKAWLKEGLEPRAMSRDIDWGVPVPIEGFTNKVVYVWFEAVIGYLSAAIEWAKNNGTPSAWESFWKDDTAEHYYFIAKDNIPFHSLFWPAQLIAYNSKYTGSELQSPLPGEETNRELKLPYNVVANMFLNIRGEKMSKSKGTFITAQELIDTFSPELVRYFFVRYAPENHDIDFEWKDLITLNNNELVATFGNFVYRVLSYAQKRFGDSFEFTAIDPAVEQKIVRTFEKVGTLLENVSFASAIQEVMALAQFGNQYLNEHEPWKITDNAEAKDKVSQAVAVVYALRTLIGPFIPSVTEKLSITFGEQNEVAWNWSGLPKSVTLKEVTPLVKKVESEEK
ncbi:MAG: methionine--tRNA ligase [Candidatus Dojkabacteria bacterium]|nr:MAG: methionine--tRNA ligase [Candidatus Dojkabacteria bacterium]